MSFTSNIKTEISKLKITEAEQISELSAIVANSSQISDTIKITTENASVARRIYTFEREIYKIIPKITVRKGYNYNKSYIYIIEAKYNLKLFLNYLGMDEIGIPLQYIIDDDNLMRSYIRGLFLSCGSINDPKKSRYHLEFLVQKEDYAEFIKEILNNYQLNSKIIKRDNKYMIYIKEAEKIGDFLHVVGAVNAMLAFEDLRIMRDMRNSVNRLVNCDTANLKKTANAAAKQVEDIQLIEEKFGLENLPEKLTVLARFRLTHPELSLKEVAAQVPDGPISKSGVNHRFQKIREIAKQLKEEN